ncbi:MAG: TonB-dependent receptor [Candidatus Firestonebacteria bacterium]|nr:TonB-dependent receptor [Candidatus Firestonebacteria bacterium]
MPNFIKTILFASCLTGCLTLPGLAVAEDGPVPVTPSAVAETAGNTEAALPLLTAGVHGKIRELGSPDALRAAMAEALGASLSAMADEKGFYRLALPAGNYNLRFSAAGHAPRMKTVQLAPGQEAEVNCSLDRVDFAAGAYVVRGKKDKPQTLTTTLSQNEIKKVPGTAGDALRAVQNLPGIAIPNDFSGQLVVQGGGPGDNLYLLDNIPWPFPFHFGGVLSTVNSDLLSSVDLNSAGFGVRWGNVLGAVLDAKTRPGKKDRLHASADINMVTSQVLVEGPLGWGDASFTLAGRRSYFDLFLRRMAGSAFTAFPYFWDLGGSLDFSLDANNHFRVLALGDDDVLGVNITADDTSQTEFSGEFKLDNRAITGGCSWVNTALPNLTSTLTPYYNQTDLAFNLGTGFNLNNRETAMGIKEEAEWKPGELLGMRHDVGFGGGVETLDYETLVYFFRNFRNGVPSDPVGTTVTTRAVNRSAYLQDRVQLWPELAVTAGLHYDKNDRVAGDVLLPRLSLEWQYDTRTLWKAAWGLYDQFPGGLQLDEHFGNPRLSAERAEHTVLGLEKKFSREFTGRVDVYYKRYYDLVAKDPATQAYGNQALGNARGVELFLREDWGEKFFGWISYAYSKSERFGPPVNNWYAYQYDQPNILTLVASYSITPPWSFGAKLHYNSGPLVQSLEGRYQDAQGTWRPVLSDTYNQRLEDYLRLDVRMDYSWRFEGWRLNAYIETLNLLNRANPAGVTYNKDYTKTEVVNNFPMLPYFGLEAEF